jgi:hypothetical protein
MGVKPRKDANMKGLDSSNPPSLQRAGSDIAASERACISLSRGKIRQDVEPLFDDMHQTPMSRVVLLKGTIALGGRLALSGSANKEASPVKRGNRPNRERL